MKVRAAMQGSMRIWARARARVRRLLPAWRLLGVVGAVAVLAATGGAWSGARAAEGGAQSDLGRELERAREWVAAGRVGAAEALLRRVTAEMAANQRTGEGLQARALGALAGVVADAAEARGLYEEVLRRWPRSPEAGRARLELARYFFATGEYWGALKQLEALREERPDFAGAAEARCLEGETELALGRNERAQFCFDEGLKLQPEPLTAVWLWIGLGDARRAQGQIAAAATAYEEAARGGGAAGGALPVAWMALAGIAEERGDRAAARDWYARVSAASPGHYAAAQQALGRLGGGAAVTAVGALGRSAAEEPWESRSAPTSTAVAGGNDPAASGMAAKSGTPVEQSAQWAVQVGAFSDRAKADALLEELRGIGARAEVVPREVGGRQVYRVWVGSYGSRDAAYMAGLDLADRLDLDFLPVQRDGL